MGYRLKFESGHPLRWLGLILCAVAVNSSAADDPTAADDPNEGFLALDFPALDCVVNPYLIVDLSSPVPGVIYEVLVERSDIVDKGQVVARLAAGVERAGVNLARARTQLDPEIRASEVNLEFDRKRKARFDSLYGRDVIAIQNKEEAEREARLSIWNLQRTKDLQKIRVLELRRAEELLAQKTIRSTIGGVVVERFKSAGEYVEDQPIVRVVQLDPLRIEAIVPMKYFGQIKPGMIAMVHPETITGAREATVTIVDPLGDPASGTFGVRLTLPNPGLEVPAGMRCDMKFVARAEPDRDTEDSDQKVKVKENEQNNEGTDVAEDRGDQPKDPDKKITWNSLAESAWNLLALSLSESASAEAELDDTATASLATSRVELPGTGVSDD